MAKNQVVHRPQPGMPDTAGIEVDSVPPPDENYSGTYTKLIDAEKIRAGDGFNYSLAIDEGDPYGKTHKARCEPTFEKDPETGKDVQTHPGFSWEGTAQEFKEQFEKA